MPGGVAEEDADLAVLDPARGSRGLPGHADRLGPRFEEAGLIDDQDAVGVAQMLADIADEFVADGVGV